MQIGLMTTNCCTALCDHCGVDASSEDKTKLPFHIAQRVIDEARSITGKHDQFMICFSGGEPFLYFDEMVELTRYATHQGAEVRCVTNCFWATSLEEAREKIYALHKAGMKGIGISCDQFHTQFASFEYIRNAFAACKEKNIIVDFKHVVVKGKNRVYDVLRGLDDMLPDSLFIVNEMRCIPLGRARNLSPEVFLYTDNIPTESCRGIGRLAVDATGEVYPCCIPARESLLCIGNVNERSFVDILHDAQKNRLLCILKDKGPGYFIPFLAQHNAWDNTQRFVNECHLCCRILELFHTHPAALHEAVDTWNKEKEKEKEAAALALSLFGEGLT